MMWYEKENPSNSDPNQKKLLKEKEKDVQKALQQKEKPPYGLFSTAEQTIRELMLRFLEIFHPNK